MDKLKEIIDGYMRESEIDYVGLWQIAAATRRRLSAHSTDEVRKSSLEIVRRLYECGLRPGDYWGDEFRDWPDEGCQAILDRIEREWIKAGADPNLAEPICWFAPQPK
jgi:hypothetical protein